ncbi:flagellar basal body P-ring formation chaperone FlgA [Thalassomonas haliotis]|uniref:Flagellar basal body P-ring formation protein FlgA n=1 Tax=Thalassomonas haliotis TaxID=485448 RepID=A0ABY7VHH4_9GAMM|nr:flagellar basal body P-ring formation chaperone FlgA [Thalassomonas haliotis]WDE12117.1 flagellar basal body P-ring formation protein FlgA [Thalassomonas haliotis]
MVYVFFAQKGKAEAEGVFPQGKRDFNIHSRFFFPGLLLTALFTSVFARAGEFEQQVQKDLQTYARQMAWPEYRQEINTWLPGKAKQLPECGQEIKFSVANQSRPPLGRVHYLISCASPKWQIRAQAKIKVWLDVWHAKNDIGVDQVINTGNVYLKNIEISRLNREFFTAGQKVENKRSIRRIRAGKIINGGQLQNVYLVKKGEEVLIRAQQGNFVATMKGMALENGMLGEKIKVENTSSKKKVQARVTENGIVETIF